MSGVNEGFAAALFESVAALPVGGVINQAYVYGPVPPVIAALAVIGCVTSAGLGLSLTDGVPGSALTVTVSVPGDDEMPWLSLTTSCTE